MNFKQVIRLENLQSKRAQVTIFIIIAIVLIASIVAYLLFRNLSPSQTQIPSDFQPVYNSFLSCVESTTLTGISVLESQGGYIYLPPFEPGSSYQPFSSDLVFLGNPIPYWYYVSGNNLPKNQVPNESLMQNQLARFIDSKIRDCNIRGYSDFRINEGTPQASVKINSNNVQVSLEMGLTLTRGNQSILIKDHAVTVNSELGNLFNSAKKVYDYEQTSRFLENYTVDVLRNYAPVDGVDVRCSPETWGASSIFNTLKSAVTNNIVSLRTGINSTNYFNVDLNVKGVSFITNPNWSSSYEVNPTQGNTLIANPIGNQAGLGILGFCYVPYHFVYSIKYPVLVAIRSGSEIFQFPLAVVVENNMPQSPASLNGTASQIQNNTLCGMGKTNITVNVLDANSNPVDANVSYECFGQTCNIGQASSGSITGDFPQCVNGYIVASAPGFKQSRYLFSTAQSGSVNIIMNKLYNETINLELDGQPYSGRAILNFVSSNGASQTLVYPAQKEINLSDGSYNISAYIYKNSSITVGATTTQQCVNIPTGGISAVLNANSQQQCFNVNVPSQVISDVLAGGGKTEYYLLGSDLANSNVININAPSLPEVTSLQQLQTNYILFENKNLSVSFS